MNRRRVAFAKCTYWTYNMLLKFLLLHYDGQSKSSQNSPADGLVHHEFVSPGQSVTGHFYVQISQRLRDAVRKRHDRWQGQWFRHHDNAPSHTSLVVQQFLAEKPIPVIAQPPHFWLLAATLKMGFKGTHFVTMEDIKSNATAELRQIPKEAFCRCSQQWQGRWSKCVYACKGPALKVIRYTSPYVLPLQCNTTIPGIFWLPLIYTSPLPVQAV
jgi:hypothetical protein